ncbi:hypothetical protein C8D87_114177 [Lentzea atacamensis]|uniref:Uncharacterized protein n=1 Tax=Lentzea atacamensis TaxID=531938 RepID=A0ABX9DW91_9PSEU|nr:hypothetical protein [Lentzea atacamensis]RAS59565.1 hypothetical protein C8D87_114177 [Lentzea atacamensis]
MKQIHFTLVNYAHGGADCSGRTGLQTSWDLDGLVEILQNGTRWPDHLTVLEAEQWDRQGGALMYAAADKLRQASGGVPYVPLLSSLTHNRGPIAPCVFVNANRVVTREWHDGSGPDFYEDARGRMLCRLAEDGDDPEDRSLWFRTRAAHLCPWSAHRKMIDVEALRNEGNPQMPSVVFLDANSTLSGPGWERTDLDDPRRDRWHCAPQIDFLFERLFGKVRPNTAPLDYLCGRWQKGRRRWWVIGKRLPGRRVGGAGMFSVADLVGDQTPTKPPHPHFQSLVTSHVLVNARWKDRITHYKVIDSLGKTDHHGVEVSVLR